jgi:hypothetical protein
MDARVTEVFEPLGTVCSCRRNGSLAAYRQTPRALIAPVLRVLRATSQRVSLRPRLRELRIGLRKPIGDFRNELNSPGIPGLAAGTRGAMQRVLDRSNRIEMGRSE